MTEKKSIGRAMSVESLPKARKRTRMVAKKPSINVWYYPDILYISCPDIIQNNSHFIIFL